MSELPDGGADRATSGTPRWVKVSGAIALLVIVLFVIVLLTGGNHGPRRHAPGSGPGAHTKPEGVTHAEER